MKQVITLSDNAANRIKEIMSNDETKSLGIRVSVKSGGWTAFWGCCWLVLWFRGVLFNWG